MNFRPTELDLAPTYGVLLVGGTGHNLYSLVVFPHSSFSVVRDIYIAFPSPFICIALHFSSGRTYANAVLVNLNGRSKLRETLDKMEPSFAKTTELGGSSSIIRRLPRLGASTYEHSSHFTTISSRSAAREIKPVVQVPSDTYPPRPFRHSLP
ncbi:hypothetical protein D9756_010694 [Leucocoprinus leucothites]|uniref:Uncharacterized protein n=1 Tax=Leucocoprinus leucothites TaxID=201217 RepID=A0A8H5CT97_9AGAR|nr:hypothetical protein D9756_010694 [Leucoagaricus leucothites]